MEQINVSLAPVIKITFHLQQPLGHPSPVLRRESESEGKQSWGEDVGGKLGHPTAAIANYPSPIHGPGKLTWPGARPTQFPSLSTAPRVDNSATTVAKNNKSRSPFSFVPSNGHG